MVTANASPQRGTKPERLGEVASPSSSLKLRFGDFGGNFFGEVIHSHYVRMEKAL